MTASTELVPPVELPVAPRNHSWDRANPRHVPACTSPSGNDQTERDCKQCQVIMVTVHAPDGRAWREWRHNSSAIQFKTRPPCLQAVTP